MRSNRPLILVINRSNGTLSDANALRFIHAIQRQVSNDFAKAWGQDAQLSYLRANGRNLPDPRAWQVIVFQNLAQAQASGYRDKTPQGKPLAFAFCEEAADAGLPISLVLSAEILSMLADPEMNGFERHSNDGLLYAREACGPVLSDELGYLIGGVKVSDFVYPAFFQDDSPAPHDHARRIKAPFERSADGFLLALDPTTGKWDDKNADADPIPGSRIGRRMRALEERLEPSEETTRTAIPSAPKPSPKVPRVHPARAAHPRRDHGIRPLEKAPPLRQPDRGAIHSERIGGASPLRQPLRGRKAELAAQRAAAPFAPPSAAVVPNGRDTFLEIPANTSIADRPAPKRQPLRGKRALAAAAAEAAASVAEDLRDEPAADESTPTTPDAQATPPASPAGPSDPSKETP